jgi:hypothetical protein
MKDKQPTTTIAQMVSKFVSVRKVQIPPWWAPSRDIPASAAGSIECVQEEYVRGDLLRQTPEYPTMREHPASRLRKRSTWLAISVRPAVQELIAHGEAQAVQEALGIIGGPSGIISSDEETWTTFNNWR